MAATENLTIDQGSSYEHAFILHAGGSTGPLFDLTGYTTRMQVRQTVGASTALLDLSVGNGLSIDTVTAKITLSLTPAQTRLLVFKTSYYDLEIELNGVVTRLIQGIITSSPEVTR